MTLVDNYLKLLPKRIFRLSKDPNKLRRFSAIGDNSLLYEIFKREIKSDPKVFSIIGSIDFDSNRKIENYYIENNNVDLICINVSEHKLNEFDNHSLNTINLKIPYVILINEPELENQKRMYFPYWLLASKIFTELDNNNSSLPKKYYVSCLSRNPRKERIYNFVKLKQLSFFSEMYITFYQKHPFTNEIINNDNIVEIDNDIKELFFKDFKSLPLELNLNEQLIVMSIDNPGYQESMLNIITETYHDTLYLSEKTFKPIRAQQLFLMCGPANSIKHLRDLGFDVFDDIIDHTYYDSESDWEKRIIKMHELLVEIYYDIPTMYKETKRRRNNNRKHLLNFRYNLLDKFL